MVGFEISVDIERPVEEVFARMTDLPRMPEWNHMVEEVVPSETHLRVGSTARVKMRILGRRIEATYEVIELEPNRRFVGRTGAPISVTDTWAFEPLDEHRARLTYGSVGETRGFFKLADPIVGRIAKKQLTAQLETFKELLEARVPAMGDC